MVDPLKEKYGSRAKVLLPLCLVGFVALSAWRMWPAQRDAAVVHEEQTGPVTLTFAGPTMGSTWKVVVAADAPVDFAREREVNRALEDVLADVDRHMSTYRDDSTLAVFNARRSTEPFPAPPALLAVVQTALEVSALSGGAFDVTAAPMIDAWGFGRRKDPSARPDDAAIAALRPRVGYTLLHVDLAAGTLRKDHPELSVDLSAIAPGYAADLLSQRLVELGYPRHLVDVGGEFRARGEGPRGPWRVGVERPDGQVEARVVHEVVALRDAALATSGDYRNYREQDGVRISHTIDPRAGRPIAHRLASVTVVHHTAALADAVATALNVLGPDEGLALATREGLPALFLVREDHGFAERATPAFAALRAPSP